MNKVATTQERRQFGRRFSQYHGWICVEGRPRQSCTVQNFSETGALLEIAGPAKLPSHFILDIDAIKFKTGCEVTREVTGALGVKFMKVDEMVAAVAAAKVQVSTYEKLLALAEAEHDMAANTEVIRNVQRLAAG